MKSLMDLIKEQDEIIKDINNVRQSGPITLDNVQGIIEKYDQIDDINTEIKNMINTNWDSKFMGEVADWFGIKPIDNDILMKNLELAKELPQLSSDDVIVLKSIDEGQWKPILLFGKLVMAHRVHHQRDFQKLCKEVELAYNSIPAPVIYDMQVLIVSVNNKTGETIMRKSCEETYSTLNHTGYKHIMIVSNSSIPYDETYEITVKPEDVCEDIRKHIFEFYPTSVSRYLKYEETLASTGWDIPLDRVIPHPEKDVTPDIVEYLKDGTWKPIRIFGKTGIAHIVTGFSEYRTLSHTIYDAVQQYKYVFNYSELLIEINNKTKRATFVTVLKNIGNPDYTYIVFGCDFEPPVSSKSEIVDILPEDICIDIESLGAEMINDPKQYFDPMYSFAKGVWGIPLSRIRHTDPVVVVKADEDTTSTPKKKHRLFISQPFTGFDDTVIMQQRAHLFDIYCAYKGYDKSDVELIENHLPDDPYDIDENFSSQNERDLYRFCRSVGMLGKATDIIFYGSFHNSKGCRLEYKICRKYNINSISQAELIRFCQTTPGFEHFVDELWTNPWGMCYNENPTKNKTKLSIENHPEGSSDESENGNNDVMNNSQCIPTGDGFTLPKDEIYNIILKNIQPVLDGSISDDGKCGWNYGERFNTFYWRIHTQTRILQIGASLIHDVENKGWVWEIHTHNTSNVNVKVYPNGAILCSKSSDYYDFSIDFMRKIKDDLVQLLIEYSYKYQTKSKADVVKNADLWETMRTGINATLDSFCDKMISDPIFNGSYKRSGSLRKITLGEKTIDIVLEFDTDLDSWLIFIGDQVKPRIRIKTNGNITEDIRVPIPEPLLCRDIHTLCVMLSACKTNKWRSNENSQ